MNNLKKTKSKNKLLINKQKFNKIIINMNQKM